MYVVVEDYTRAVYTRPLRLKSEVVEAFQDAQGVPDALNSPLHYWPR